MADTELRERAVARFMLNRLHDHGFVLAGLGGLREHGVSDLVEGRVVLVTTDAHRHSDGLREVRDFLGEYRHGTTHSYVPGVGLMPRSGPDPWPVCTFAMEYDDGSVIDLQLGTAERINAPIGTDTGPVASLDDIARPAICELSNSGAIHRHAYLMIDEIRRSRAITDDRLLDLARAGDPDFIRGHLVHHLEDARDLTARDFDLPGDQLDADRLAGLVRRCADWAEEIVRSIRPDDRFDPFLADRVPEMARRNTISAPELARRLIEAARPNHGRSARSIRKDGTDRAGTESDDNITYVDQRRWRLGPRRGREGRTRGGRDSR